MFKREREQWMTLLAEEREAHRLERQELLNRIAAPERVIHDKSPVEHKPEPMSPNDLELSYVGREVPEGVSVGSLRVVPDGDDAA